MTLAFTETTNFMEYRDDYFVSDHYYSAVQQSLLSDPQSGSVIRGCGGLRKMRWPDPRRGKGKRGGLRIIYLYLPEYERIVFLDVYDKDEADDLTPSERKEYAELANRIRLEFKQKEKVRGKVHGK